MTLTRAARRTAALASLAVVSGLALAAPSQANHQTVTGLTTDNTIVQFAVGTPGTLVSGPSAITGLAGDDLLGIDFRPRTGTLYTVGAAGQVYLLTPPATFPGAYVATAIGTPGADPANVSTGLDFNPVPDAIRLVNGTNDSFRFNPNSGGLILQDTDLAFAAGDANFGDDPEVGAAAYTNNFDGALNTTLFDVDATNDALVRQGDAGGAPISPNAGTLTTIGTLPGGDVTSLAGFDIETQTGNAYAALQTTGDASSILYRLDLTTGAALNTFGAIAGGALVESVSLRPIPQLQFANTVTSAREGTAAGVIVNRQGPLNQQATVNYATEVATGDTAQAADFTATTGTLTFAPGDAQETITVPTTGDTANEVDETFTVRLSAPSVSVNLPATPTTKVNVTDDDDAPVTPAKPGKPGAAPFGLINVPTQKIDGKITARFICDDLCTAKLTLRLGGKALDTAAATQTGFGSKKVTFDLSKREVKRVKAKAKGPRSAKLSAGGVFTDADGTSRSSVKFQLG